MIIQGHVQNGVVILDNDMVLPEGAEVTVSCAFAGPIKPEVGVRVQLPLVVSQQPGACRLTAELAAELLGDDELSR